MYSTSTACSTCSIGPSAGGRKGTVFTARRCASARRTRAAGSRTKPSRDPPCAPAHACGSVPGQRARACNRRRVRPHRVEAVESRQQRVLVRVEVLEVGWQHAPAYAHHCCDSWPVSGPRRGGRASPGKRRRQQARMWEGRAQSRAQSRRRCGRGEPSPGADVGRSRCSTAQRRLGALASVGRGVHQYTAACARSDHEIASGCLRVIFSDCDAVLMTNCASPLICQRAARMAHAMQRRTQAHLVGQHIHDKHVPSRS